MDCLYSAARGTKTTVSWWFPRSIMSKLTAFERYTIGLPLFCCKRDKNYCTVVVSTQHHAWIDCFRKIHVSTAFILLQEGQKLLYRGGFHAASCLNWLLAKDTRLDCRYSAARGTKTTVSWWFPRSIMSNWLLSKDTAFRWTAFILLQEGQKLLYRGGFHAASCLNWLLSKNTAFRWTAFILLQEGQKLLYRGGFHAASCLNWLLSKDTRLDCLYFAARGTKTTVSWWFPRSIMSKLTAFERYTIGLPLFCCKRDKNYCIVVTSTQHHV